MGKYRRVDVPDKYLYYLAEWLDKWSLKETSLTIPQFCSEYGVAFNYLTTFIRQDDDIRDAYSIAKARLSSRWLEKGLQNPDTLPKIILGYLKNYDEDLIKTEKSLKQSSGQPIVQIPNYQTQSYAGIELEGKFKEIYDDNINKHRGESSSESV